mmetsp:Transcript_32858/g.79872  ORF Transcript_32858/g.79872 Transcript_32858/m.79872 type:complete len:505 (-) Transcript_32858:32-1546(-)
MTEVKTSPAGNLGLYATKDYASGDEILVENSPLIRLAPISDEASEKLLLEWKGDQKKSTSSGASEHKTLWDAIISTDKSEGNVHQSGVFKGMVQAGLIWTKTHNDVSPDTKKLLLDLYSPSSSKATSEDDDAEKACLDISEKAISFLRSNPFSGSTAADFDDWETLRKVMMIWGCNSFEGGRVYRQLSRVNHDCNPNAIIQSKDEQQRLVAGTAIKEGEEITISYLGLILYSDFETRQLKLKTTKFFECRCDRCKNVANDAAASIPCPNSYPRQDSQFTLDEDIQYDDDQTVSYVTMSSDNVDDKRLFKVLQNVCKKVRTYLDTYESQNNTNTASTAARDDDDDDEENDLMILEEHISLSDTMLGDRHWTSNLLRLLHLDRRLKIMSKKMITTQELPEMEDVAEAIDSLQRISRYVDSINLKLHSGHIIGDVTVGVARTLVSLGDEKSCRYATEWLEKVDEYVDKYGDDGLQKVVAALKVAWKKHVRDDDPEASKERRSKKIKT